MPLLTLTVDALPLSEAQSTLSSLVPTLQSLPAGEPGCDDLYCTGAKLVLLDKSGKVAWENHPPSGESGWKHLLL
jgi:hypothetical protein